MAEADPYIRRYELDGLLSDDLLAALRPRRSDPGDYIIRSGDPVSDVMFFVEGRAKAYGIMDNGQSILAAFYTPFDVFGEAELFSTKHYALTVEAISSSVCLCLSVEVMLKAAPRNYRLFMYLCGRLGSKLTDRFTADSVNLRYSVESRLASYLLASADAEGGLVGTDALGELADFIGASYRQLARVVHRFREEGILDPSRGRIRVLDGTKLAALAGDSYVQTGSVMKPGSFGRRDS
ncbi:MAG: cyclic nucleotide-binding domain-containing protein [Spirochaetia bacterium]|jgi:CRP-like cAMP-binding protein|nr:cyclic nucleotide-binding domain-containing protein [Spirochaetia bacterium]